jgi:phage FluMu protein Com
MKERRCPTCNRLLAKADGPVEARCKHCKVIVVFDGPRSPEVPLPIR